jgi:hypothetical protein
MRATLGLLLVALGCGHAPQEATVAAPARTWKPPAAIDDCAPDRLSVLEMPVDLGAPYASWQWLPLDYALRRHSFASDSVVLLLVPEAGRDEKVATLRALRFEVSKRQWLPEARYTLPQDPRLGPRYTEVDSGPIAAGYAVAWVDIVTRVRRGVVFSLETGVFRAALASELTALPAYNGLSTHAAAPPDPEPTTGVSVVNDIMGSRATFSRAGVELGQVHFPSLPGTYVGAFPATKTAFFWHHAAFAAQATLPPDKRRESYLVSLESGATCHVARELAYPATVVFRRPTFIAFVNALHTAAGVSDCPPGAPCVAPPASHFAGASLVVFSDRGR